MGHALVILAKAVDQSGEPMVLVSDANRFVDENGNVVSDGKLRLRWLTQDEFSKQYEREEDRNLGLAQSQIVVIRPQLDEQVRTILDQQYHGSLPVETDAINNPDSNWKFKSDEQGNLTLPFENSVALQTENVGEMRPIESIYIHWSGAASTDPSTWTAEMVENGLMGEETSSTFAVGVDKIVQMAKLTPTHVQETYATPWQHGAINIEMAGEDFDNNPPSKEEYQKTVDLVTELLISANKPVSIVKPHYSEIYMWSDNMPNRLGEVGNWMILDSRDLTTAKYWDQASESWVSLSEAKYHYNPATVQSKSDPGEQFFAQLTSDVQQRLIALGRNDLAEMQPSVESHPVSSEDLLVRIIDKDNPITREEIETEIVPNLISVDAVSPVLAEAAIGDDILLHKAMTPDLTAMIEDSRSANISLYLSSGYRSFNDQLGALLESNNDESLAMLPGRSQHHSGMAIDFTTGEIGYVVDINAGFENTEAGKWLVENGWKYGFVQSYTKGHDGVQNEPWHYYYVGKEIARIWHESQMTQEPKDIFEIMEELGKELSSVEE
jgi:LAS superfamily LD-carboxypeptidase LdcB